jgi:predicted nucleotidyltransferase
MPSIEPTALNRAVAHLRHQLPGLAAVYLFGTAATDTLRPDSDVDLAVDVASPLGPERLWDCAGACGEILGRDCDLVELRRAPLPLQAHIVAEGRRLFVARAVEQAFFENTVLSRYCASNEERRPLLAAIRQRGSIYA